MIIWWIRRDLRLSDNPALQAALASGSGVVPVFVLDEHILKYPAAKRQAFLLAGLRQLDQDLRARGSRLLVREGAGEHVLRSLLAETGATAIVAEEGYSPYSRRRDADIARTLPLRLTAGLTIHQPAKMTREDGSPYTSFTPFRRAWKQAPTSGSTLPVPARLPPVPERLVSNELPDANPPDGLTAGEHEGQRRLCAFAKGDQAPIFGYAEGRTCLDGAGASLLSAYLRFGMVSPRQAAAAAQAALAAATTEAARTGAEVWLDVLIRREFCHNIVFHFADVLQGAFRPESRGIEWLNDGEDFAAWCDGRTGYPVIDAAMRQLVQTGWLSERARMIAASFLVKDLLVDWRWGERFFMEHLVDGDAAANSGGWQRTAGVGADTAPYVHVFNPILQARRFDPQGIFVRRWLPALAHVPDRFVHAPWRMRDSDQRKADCVIGQDYPAPIVDHKVARARALAVYRLARAPVAPQEMKRQLSHIGRQPDSSI